MDSHPRLLASLALVVGSTPALGGCAGGPGDPAAIVTQERLSQAAWSLSDVGDFDGDGVSDILWDHTGKGEMAVWLMTSPDVFTPGPVLPGPPGAGWSADWTSDFNADGFSDVRWYNNDNQEAAIWLMSGSALLFPGPTFDGPLGAGWTRSACADFDGDGLADILWRNTLTQAAEVWLMHGTKPFSRGAPISPPPGDGWIARTATDFNSDGMNDILWANPTLRLFTVGLMNGAQQVARGPLIPMPAGDGWRLVTATDLGGDNQADTLWYNATT